ncbi:hypothetical protein [uncultured Ferrimonas sp.]|uniref:hypothetical protein n=1 Tax=uncultured Ferrimonas sp. TaxID=432640 RepID=UPI00261AFF1D|nr:hypothetical protein [uncultured Ferrimonas sp.]
MAPLSPQLSPQLSSQLSHQLDEVLLRVAMVHQQHSIKGFLALQDLQHSLALTDSEVTQLLPILAQEPLLPLLPLQQTLATRIPPRRWQWLLQHSVYPACYFVMRDWIAEQGFMAVCQHYLDRACQMNGELGHYLTVLLALRRLWPQLSPTQQPRLIERFTEFVTTTFNAPVATKPLAADYRPPTTVAQLQQQVLQRPGFLAHNWITLAALRREQQTLTPAQYQQQLTLLHQRCFWQHQDAADQPQIDWQQGQASQVPQRCRALLFDSGRDLHQLTIADSVMWLQQHGGLTASQQGWLAAGLTYFIADCRD